MRKLTKSEQKQTWGTSLQGEIETSYSNLVSKFGSPNSEHDEYKTDAEWALKDKGTVITIYNYKNGHNYLGKRGKDVANIRTWHIGGKTKKAVDIIKKHFPNSRVVRK